MDGKGTIVTAVIDLPPNRVGRYIFEVRSPWPALRTAPYERPDLTVCSGLCVCREKSASLAASEKKMESRPLWL